MRRESEAGPEGSRKPGFAHASEAEFARILDFYQVGWEYEPSVFPILWDLEGNVLESFAPDFYLPDLDVFVEMTTLQQRLVRKKNRKVRRLRELYPALRIKLFYARDFRALMLKYGRSALVDELSGTVGQVGQRRAGGLAREAAVPGGRPQNESQPLAPYVAGVVAPPGPPQNPLAPSAARPSPPALDSPARGAGRSRSARRRAARRAARNPSVT